MRRVDDRCRRIGPHAAGVRPGIAVAGALVILRRGKRDRSLAIAQREEGGFLAVEEFLDHDFAAGLAQGAAEHHVDRRFRFGQTSRHDDTLAGGKPVGLDHDRRAAAADVSLGRRRGAKAFIGGRGNAVRPAQVLGEALGAFEAGGGAARAEGLDAGGFEVIDDACAERRLGPDNDQIDAILTAIRDHCRMVGNIKRNAFRLPGNACIAGGADEPVRERACRHLPGQRMFAAAGAEQQDVHGLSHIAGAPLARQRPGATCGGGARGP